MYEIQNNDAGKVTRKQSYTDCLSFVKAPGP